MLALPDNTHSIFEPLAWQARVWNDHAPIVLLTGSAGGGKSRIMLEIGHAFCLRYPMANVLALRKKLEDAKRSIVPTLDDVVIGILFDRSIRKVSASRHYLYPNRSRLWWGGMHGKAERESLRSIGAGGSLDLVLMEEGTEFDEDDINEVFGRLRGRAGPWTQLIMATNPGPPAHWINRRLIIGGEASVHLSSVEDNIYMDDLYKRRLMNMTGVTKARMALGLWVEGTGVVLDGWSNTYNAAYRSGNDGNVTLSADYIPGGGRVIAAVDDGYVGEFDERAKMFTQNSHPRVVILAQVRSTGQICVFAESYEIKTRYQDHLNKIKNMCAVNSWPLPSEVYYDKSSATLEGELRQAGFYNLLRSTSQKDESIKFLNERVAPDENGFRHVLVHPRCRHLILEMSSWPIVDGAPAKWFDHGPDALRYMVYGVYRGVGSTTMGIPDDYSDTVAQSIRDKSAQIDAIMDRLDAQFAQMEI